LNTLLIG